MLNLIIKRGDKMKNIIYFENGIKHELTSFEIQIMKKALLNFEIESNDEKETYENLLSLFIHHLD